MSYPETKMVRQTLTGSDSGASIKVNSTSTGVEIHTHDASFNQSLFDELHLWAYNSDSSARTLTLQWGGTTSPDNLIVISIAAGSFLKVVDGIHISGNLDVKAVASAANVVMVYGYALSYVKEHPNKESDYASDESVYYNGYTQR